MAPSSRKSQADRALINDLRKLTGVGIVQDNAHSSRYAFDDPYLRVIREIKEEWEGIVWLQKTLDFVEKILLLREPRREGCLANIESNRLFEGVFTTIILMNAIFMVIQVNWDIEHPEEGPSSAMVTVDRVFLALYSIELAVKLSVHRLYFFWNADTSWNILDFSLVTYSFVEFGLSKIAGETTTGKATWMRSLRLFRIAKVLRILRVVKAFKQLQLVLNCILGSLQSLVWSVVMIIIMFYMFSLMLAQQTGLYLTDYHPAKADSADLDMLLAYFGTVQGCMWTLFKATFGADDWSVYYDEMYRLGPLARFVWFCFVVFTQIALLNILTGIFVENALQLADGDSQSQAMKYEEKAVDDAIELRKMCVEFDKNEDRKLNQKEFIDMIKGKEFARYLKFIGVQMADMQMFFNLLAQKKKKKGGSLGSRRASASSNCDDEKEEEEEEEEQEDFEEVVDIPDFVAGCMQLKGAAKLSDLLALMYEMKNIKHQLEQKMEDTLDKEFRALRADLRESLPASPSSARLLRQPSPE